MSSFYLPPRGFLVNSLSVVLFLIASLLSQSSFYLVHSPKNPVSPLHLFFGTLVTLGRSVVVVVQGFKVHPQCIEEGEAKLFLFDVSKGSFW